MDRLERYGLVLAVLCCIGCEPSAVENVPENHDAPSPPPAESIEANVSAYCACDKCCGKWADGITASGHKIKPGDRFVAADKRYAFGTMVTIPGYGRVPILDRGGAIRGNKIDVYHDTHKQALRWGRQYLSVTIERKKQ